MKKRVKRGLARTGKNCKDTFRKKTKLAKIKLVSSQIKGQRSFEECQRVKDKMNNIIQSIISIESERAKECQRVCKGGLALQKRETARKGKEWEMPFGGGGGLVGRCQGQSTNA